MRDLTYALMTTFLHELRHDPYAPGMAEKYGMPGKTDNEGWSRHVFIAVFWPSDDVWILRILEYLWGVA